MSANSPTYDCPNDAILPSSINTTGPYCIVPGGAPRMETCCTTLLPTSQLQVSDSCFAWCTISLSNTGSNSQQAQLQTAAQTFAYCLSHGENATAVPEGDGRTVICRYEGQSNVGALGNVNLTATPTAEGLGAGAVTGGSGVSGSASTTPNVGAREVVVAGGSVKGLMVLGSLFLGGVVMRMRI
ncbi:hypothetical protein K431DRAFT_349868 [Polychaeton citri CBS 116435]|uniref:Uncharacterized protein n=1 Tax=Polychaeton citri CBS 116435 TaxID=1314669 RepID=A0A9P4Q246_9PEZI|nr:hypothetical protein K431DRAFT_349868 [Polychaeton citri CBS 116435]